MQVRSQQSLNGAASHWLIKPPKAERHAQRATTERSSATRTTWDFPVQSAVKAVIQINVVFI